MYTLGINAAFHDCSACLVADGVVIAAAEEERFTRVKHGKRPLPFTVWQLPYHAIGFCLEQAGIALPDVAHVAYAYDPHLQLGARRADATIALPLEPSSQPGGGAAWEALGLAYVVNAPRQLADGAPHHLQHHFRGVRHDGPYRWHYVGHHQAHEASAYLAAPYDSCAVLVMDGRGEQACTSYGVAEGGRYRRLAQVNYPHSLGLLYEYVTAHLGFLRSSDEYKVMALASYGVPRYLEQLRGVLSYRGDGHYETREAGLAGLFAPRQRGEPLDELHADLASSLQHLLEETVMAMATWLHGQTNQDNLAMAGGVALNCVMNAVVRDRGPFSSVWVQPAAGDAGTALGAALLVDARERQACERAWTMAHAYLGPAFTDDDIEQLLRQSKLQYRKTDDIAGDTARLLAQDKIVGWFQGRMEFGPRALGARSILASPIDAGMQERLNTLKDREDFRPVAPVVLEEAAADWFVDGGPSPFMLFVYQVRPEMAGRIPAVRHVDGTARIQTVARAHNPLMHALLSQFAALTGVPILVNTSFNTRGEPIVCTPRDALESFCTTPLDALAIGSFLLEKGPLLEIAP